MKKLWAGLILVILAASSDAAVPAVTPMVMRAAVTQRSLVWNPQPADMHTDYYTVFISLPSPYHWIPFFYTSSTSLSLPNMPRTYVFRVTSHHSWLPPTCYAVDPVTGKCRHPTAESAATAAISVRPQ